MDIKSKLTIAVLVVAVLTALCLLARSGAGGRFIVVRPAAVALYREGDTNARDDELLYGHTGDVEAGPDRHRRYTVRTAYGYRTQVSRDDILLDTARAAEWERNAGHLVAAPFADVLPVPDPRAYPPLVTLPRGALLAVSGEEGDCFRVSLHNGATGYVRKPSLRALRKWEETDEAENRRRVVADAESYLGTAYRWGGKTPEGIDCSGLASMAYLLNGLAIHRNSQPRPGYPIALLHVEVGPEGKFSMENLAGAKPGDLIYWKGHMGVYVGEGKYIHANATSFDARVNSLLEGDAEYRADLAAPKAVHTWGTAYPAEPDRLIVRRLEAEPAGGEREFRFHARADGYAPTRAVLYPEGEGKGKPALPIADPRRMLYDDPDSDHADVPRHRYAAPGRYRSALVLINDAGWRPGGKDIVSDVFVMPEELVVE